ncbi:WD repeat-containing protein 43-like [Xenia sp. Carnegie-2017]|uniref:WD repeat-containing protein 43-like n=1 Tax=Xenia sp. Carnegie-2017 TaxID=2897299 RepID=UPI001F04205C|nr:WD repeat-containing protein 43-like [Xenia sp. Carnegie-2017]
MDNRVCCCKFENDGRFFALITPDGRLKVWDCNNGKLKHDVTPKKSLQSSPLTCLSWRVSEKIQTKRRKRKANENISLLESSCEIAVGSKCGNILLFNVLTGEFTNNLKEGHVDRVNDVKFHRTSNFIYSCSSDRYIAEWDMETEEIKCKWKGDKLSVHSLQVSPKGDCLLSAGRDIRLWDLGTKEILQKFTGHATSVSQLLFTQLKNDQMSSSCETDGFYFLSSAEQDRFINAWKVDLKSADRSSVVSFAISDDAVSIELSRFSGKSKTLCLVVVSLDGQLQLFKPTLNGPVKKPVNPQTTLQLATPATKETTPEPIPVISAQFVDSSEPSLLIAYGSVAKPVFETINYETLDDNVCLVRDYRPGLLLREENNNQRSGTNKAVVKNDLLTTVSVENMALARPSCGESGSSTHINEESTRNTNKEPSMEDRLKTMNLTPSTSEGTTTSTRGSTPKVGSLTQMLVQALNSQDKKLLEDVLNGSTKPKVIQSTLRRLPVNYVIPFLTELVQRIQSSPSRGSHLVPWIKNIMSIHMAYLMTVPNLVDSLGGLYQLFESRVGIHSRLCKLQGRLDLMLSQVAAQTDEVIEKDQLNEPMMIYKEDDSDQMSDFEAESDGSVESMADVVSSSSGDESEEDASTSEDDGRKSEL